MRKSILFIMTLILIVTGCRASLESNARRESTTATVAALELRRVDSLWSSLVERLKYKIEFYPTTGLHTNIQENPEVFGSPPRERTLPPSPADPSAALLGQSTSLSGNGGGCGSVKSIEITAERSEESFGAAKVDSASHAENHNTEVRQTEKASEARQDNGTVATVCIVFAVAALAYLLLKAALKP